MRNEALLLVNTELYFVCHHRSSSLLLPFLSTSFIIMLPIMFKLVDGDFLPDSTLYAKLDPSKASYNAIAEVRVRISNTRT